MSPSPDLYMMHDLQPSTMKGQEQITGTHTAETNRQTGQTQQHSRSMSWPFPNKEKCNPAAPQASHVPQSKQAVGRLLHLL
mmetsp:Transcript_8537/g.14458  ORF Transcript_8537/g.14458 Transcript_8537/m.14458 type:complete len:81 (-) Transcript_8537:1044-1286(-)